MSKMDDMAAIMADNPELQQAAAEAGQTLKDAGVTQAVEVSTAELGQLTPTPENNSDANTNEDVKPAQFKDIDAEVGGNMEGKNQPPAATQMDNAPDISDSAKGEQESTTKMDAIESPQNKVSGAEHAGTISQAPEQGYER